MPAGPTDAPLRMAFPLGQIERLFPYLWAPSTLGAVVEPVPDIRDALLPPRSA